MFKKLLLITIGLFSVAASAEGLDTGDTAWMLTSTALVLFMTLPGLALFYAGLVRSKNAVSVLMQCFTIACLVSIVWVVYGYSLAFKGDGLFIGDLSAAFLSGIGRDTLAGTIPESVFVVFQMTFAIITPALVVGAFAERMKFSVMCLFTLVWVTFVHLPKPYAWQAGKQKLPTLK
jgi:Amt family ammonium transporter